MPHPLSEPACTAAIDLPDVRCAATEHPHRGAHVATGTTAYGDRWSLFWWTPEQQATREDAEQPLDASVPVPDPGPPPRPARTPARLRRTDYARALVQP
jgi:hypothetical protein